MNTLLHEVVTKLYLPYHVHQIYLPAKPYGALHQLLGPVREDYTDTQQLTVACSSHSPAAVHTVV